MIYSSGQNILKIAEKHDPDSIKTWEVYLKPPTWTAGTVYERRDSSNFDIVLPTTFTGLQYEVENPGLSHASTEPSWVKTVDAITEDFEAGETTGLTWKAKPYAYLPIGKTLSTATVTATNGVTVSAVSNTTTTYTFTIDDIASDAAARTAKSFQVKAHCTLSDGNEFDATFEVKVAEK